MATQTEYTTDQFKHYVITGTDRNNRRFRMQYESWFMARNINLWRGRVYGVLKTTGKRVLLKTVLN
jgi:hypothetical protein